MTSERIAVVTGASRGLGRGIARALGNQKFTVFLSGRSEADLKNAAAEVEDAGGQATPVLCDHRDDAQVQALFDQVRKKCGRLDILVNNAAAVYPQDLATPGPFWKKPLHLADMIDVGLRSHYAAAFNAAPLMIETGASLMAHISFYGAVSYFHGPAYGAAKAGTDKMSFDMAVDLRPHDVASVSIWPEFTGLVVERLWRDPQRMQLSGETLIGAELGQRFGIRDLDGKQPLIYQQTMGSPSNRFLIPAAQ